MTRWLSSMGKQIGVEIRARVITTATLATLLATGTNFQALGIEAPTEGQDFLKARPEAVEAWKDMRFGIFICWGPVSLTGQEIGWSRGRGTPIEEYDNLYKKWKPDKFDAHEWIKVVKETGARYIVFLLKHRDGFCLWDTKQTDYSICYSSPARSASERQRQHPVNRAEISVLTKPLTVMRAHDGKVRHPQNEGSRLICWFRLQPGSASSSVVRSRK